MYDNDFDYAVEEEKHRTMQIIEPKLTPMEQYCQDIINWYGRLIGEARRRRDYVEAESLVRSRDWYVECMVQYRMQQPVLGYILSEEELLQFRRMKNNNKKN